MASGTEDFNYPRLITYQSVGNGPQYGLVRAVYQRGRRKEELLVQDIAARKRFAVVTTTRDDNYAEVNSLVAKNYGEAKTVLFPEHLPTKEYADQNGGELCLFKSSDGMTEEMMRLYTVASMDKPGNTYQVVRPTGALSGLFLTVYPASKMKLDKGLSCIAYRKAS